MTYTRPNITKFDIEAHHGVSYFNSGMFGPWLADASRVSALLLLRERRVKKNRLD